MSFEKITCFFLSLLIKLRPQKSPEKGQFAQPQPQSFCNCLGRADRPKWGHLHPLVGSQGRHTHRHTVSNVQPQHNVLTLLPDHIPRGEVSTRKREHSFRLVKLLTSVRAVSHMWSQTFQSYKSSKCLHFSTGHRLNQSLNSVLFC